MEDYIDENLFVDPISRKPLSTRNISCWIKKLVLVSQPGLNAGAHDLRKVVSTEVS